MTEKKEIKDVSLEKTAGGALSGPQAHSFKCSCGNVVKMGKNVIPKFPCPKCMKKEWEYIGCTSLIPNIEEPKDNNVLG